MKTNSYPGLELLQPDIERDAIFAFGWFTRPEGEATLLSMGNAKSEIEEPTLDGQRAIMQEFLDLERDQRQITRAIIVDNKTVGFVWVELVENHGVMSPSVHIMIGDPDYRGKGIGRAAMQAAIDYIKNVLKSRIVYTRHLANNIPVTMLNQSLGFEKDGSSYTDDNGLVWQNIKMKL